MKTIMISKGLKGRKDLEEYHRKCKDVIDLYFDKQWQSAGDIAGFKHIEGFNYSNNKHRLQALINTMQTQLMIADVVVFMDDWYNFGGCCIEHEVCKQYGIPIVYLNSVIDKKHRMLKGVNK